MRRILILVDAPFCRRDYDRYGIDVLQRRGFEVYVWDLTFALLPNLRGVLIPPDPIEWEYHIVFDSRREAVAAIHSLGPGTLIMSTVAFGRNTLGIFRAISKNGIPYVTTTVSNVLPLQRVATVRSRLNRIGKIFIPGKLASYVVRRVPLRLFNVSPATFVIAEGLRSDFARPEVRASTRVIRTHSLDYDLYLESSSSRIDTNGTAVFLDNYLPFHPDSHFSGEPPPVTPEVFYSELRGFFETLEQQHEFEVVVAAHPRSKYDLMPDLFGGRPVIRGRTAELVRNASLVVLSFSTSLNFAVLYRKPVVFVTTDELENSRYTGFEYGKYVSDLAAYLGKTPINISQPFDGDLTGLFEIDDAAYQTFRQDFIKAPGSTDLPFWEIVCNEIIEYSARQARSWADTDSPAFRSGPTDGVRPRDADA